jgi:hypothetical protein
MNFRRGDKVSIVGTVKHNFTTDQADPDKRVFVDVDGTHETIWIKPDCVTLKQSHFEVDDRCTWEGWTDDPGTILAISEGHAWIDMGGGSYCTRLLTTIERVDDDETQG